MRIESLMEKDEAVAEYTVTGQYRKFRCIMPADKDVECADIAGELEETLHRILEAGGTDDEIWEIMGAYIPSEGQRKELEEFDEYVEIDLGYVLPGLLETFEKAA